MSDAEKLIMERLEIWAKLQDADRAKEADPALPYYSSNENSRAWISVLEAIEKWRKGRAAPGPEERTEA